MNKADFLRLPHAGQVRAMFAATGDERQEMQSWLDEENDPQRTTVETVPTEGVVILPGCLLAVPLSTPGLDVLQARKNVTFLMERADGPGVFVRLPYASGSTPTYAVGQAVTGGRKCDDVQVWDTITVLYGDPLDPDSAIGPFPVSSKVVTILGEENWYRLGSVEKATPPQQPTA